MVTVNSAILTHWEFQAPWGRPAGGSRTGLSAGFLPGGHPTCSGPQPEPCLNSSPRVLSSNFQPLPLGITGPTQLKEAFSLTPGIPRNTSRRHMTKLLPTPCRPSLPPQTTSRRCGGPTRCTLALQGLMAPALLFLREKPTPLLFLPATLGRADRPDAEAAAPCLLPLPSEDAHIFHRARLCRVSHL